MIRLTAMLCIALFGTMSVLGEKTHATSAKAFVARDPAPTPEAAQPALLLNASFTPEVIAPPRPKARVIEVAETKAGIKTTPVTFGAATATKVLPPVVKSDAPKGYTKKHGTPVEHVQAEAGEAQIVIVTGSTVNLRAAPSTKSAVVKRLTRGTRAEVISTGENGWFQIKVADNGATGFMSSKFLAPSE